ncbi:MAG TPA: hypothetical protein VGH84_06495, partial [Steroidobacteraceae bacterium]
MIVSVVLPGAVTELAVSAQLVPAGHPDTVSATALLNPPIEPTVMVEVLTCPCAALTDDGLAESEKSGGGCTVTLTLVLRVPVEPLPLTVTLLVPVGVVAPAFTERVA